MQVNECGCIRVEVAPNLSELLGKLIVEHARLLYLRLIITLQYHGNKELKEDQADNEVVAGKVSIG